MGFDIKQLTQDMEQDLFTITTHYPILLAQYHDCYLWGKFGHSLLPPMILLNARQNLQLRSTYCNTLQQLLCIDLDGNLSTPMNPPTEAKLKEYVSILFRGMFNTTTQGKIFDKHMKKSESRQLIIKKVREIALSAMIFPLSIFTFLFHLRIPKHDFLESTHELLQQVYIKMKTEPSCFCLFPGDLSLYTLKWVCCC